jgi:hypothetical protein
MVMAAIKEQEQIACTSRIAPETQQSFVHIADGDDRFRSSNGCPQNGGISTDFFDAASTLTDLIKYIALGRQKDLAQQLSDELGLVSCSTGNKQIIESAQSLKFVDCALAARADIALHILHCD